MTAETFNRLRPRMLNPLGQAFAFLPKEVQDGLDDIPKEYIQEWDVSNRYSGDTSWFRNLHYGKTNIIRIDPSWSGPEEEEEERLPETDGDLHNPATLAALQNPKRIRLELAPESWKRDLIAAAKLDARWDFGPQSRWMSDRRCAEHMFGMKSYAYYIDPSWTPTSKVPVKPETVDYPVIYKYDRHAFATDTQAALLADAANHCGFVGYVYPDAVRVRLRFKQAADGMMELDVPVSVRFRKEVR